MSRELELLDRLYNSFIDFAEPKDFFNGLCDYMEYLESVPAFKSIFDELLNKFKIIEDNLQKLDLACVKQMKEVHKELSDYVSKNKIESVGINEALRDFNGHLDGTIVGSRSLGEALHDQLSDIIRFLYEKPEHKEFASKYISFWRDGVNIEHWLMPKGVKQYFDFLTEGRELYKTELWGKMNDIFRYYKIIKHGRERRKELVKSAVEDRDMKATYELTMSHDILYGEWKMVEEGKSNRKPIFYNVENIKPTMVRFQMYILLKLNEKEKELKAGIKHKNNQQIEKITIIELKSGKYLLAVNDDYKGVKKIRKSKYWAIFIEEVLKREVLNRTDNKKVSDEMAEYFNNNKKCLIYMNGKYDLIAIFNGSEDEREINWEVKTEIIDEDTYLSRLKKENKK